MPENTELLKELRALRKDVQFIKEHMQESMLTEEERRELTRAMQELNEGKTMSLDEFERRYAQHRTQ